MFTVEELVAEEIKLNAAYKKAIVAKKAFDSGFQATKKAVTDFEAKKAIVILEIQLEKEKAKLGSNNSKDT